VVQHKDPKQVTGELKGLSLCVASNQLSQVRELLNLGHDVNTVDADGDRTPLHWAAARGHRECIDLLLKAGADKTARDAEGRTPSELAVDCDRPAIRDLIKYGAPRQDSKKMTGTEGPVSMRCALGNPQELAGLLRAFEIEKRKRASELEKDPRLRELFSVNKRDADGDRFPLHWAAARGSTACVKMLIEAGATIGALDANGNTAAALAFQFNQRATHEVLLRAIADLPLKASLLA
jgi:ankyrin repeat protein